MGESFVELGASISPKIKYFKKKSYPKDKMERVWKLIKNDSFDCPNILMFSFEGAC